MSETRGHKPDFAVESLGFTFSGPLGNETLTSVLVNGEEFVREETTRALRPALDRVIAEVEGHRKMLAFRHWDTGEMVMADPRSIAYALRALRESTPADPAEPRSAPDASE